MNYGELLVHVDDPILGYIRDGINPPLPLQVALSRVLRYLEDEKCVIELRMLAAAIVGPSADDRQIRFRLGMFTEKYGCLNPTLQRFWQMPGKVLVQDADQGQVLWADRQHHYDFSMAQLDARAGPKHAGFIHPLIRFA